MKIISLSSSIEEKAAWAKDCYARYESRFLDDDPLVNLLARLRQAILESREAMKTVGIPLLCNACETDEGGSCCGAGIENHYDGYLILINLLLGVRLPDIRNDPQGCFFLGKNGCVLMARQVICINYVCQKITHRFGPEKMYPLRVKEGQEVDLLFMIHESLKKMMRNGSLDK